MTAATGLKRLAIAVAALVAAAFATLIGFSFLIPAATVRDAVKREIRAVTGLDPTLRGDVAMSLFPHATVSFRNVELGDSHGAKPAVVADEMTTRLRYFPLLAGRIEIADVTLVRPTINITLSGNKSNWSGLAGSLTHAVAPNPNRTASFSEIGIRDGTITVHDTEQHLDEQLEDVNFQLAWPSISRSFAANGHFTWNGETVDTSLTLTDFLAALGGDRSGVKLRLTSEPLNLTFDGTASEQQTLKMDGTLSIDAPSLRKAMRWTGKQKLPFGGFGRFALHAQSSVDGGAVSLTNVNVELDGNRAEGVLTLGSDSQRTVQGTLASDALDLTPYVSGVRLLTAGDRSWEPLPIALDGLADFNLDLRLSAGSIKVADAQIGRTAVVVNMRGGKLNVTIGESQAFGGTARGSFGVANADGGVTATSHLQFEDADLAACLGQMFGMRKVEGRGTLTLDLSGNGDSIWALTRTLNGTASLIARDGALVGIDVEQLLRRLEKRPLSGNGDFRSGRTPFDQLVLNATINQGTVALKDLHINNSGLRVAIAGQASVPSRDLDLSGKASLIEPTSTDQFDLPFVIQGPWDSPLILPDASSLIRHSDAAAPVLDAVKRHSAGDAVRSVIDQLFAAPNNAGPLADTPAATTTPKTR